MNKILKNLQIIDRKIAHQLLRLTPQNFAKLWVSKKDFHKHLKKRTRLKEIATPQEYIDHIKEAFSEPQIIYYLNNHRSKIVYVGKKWLDLYLDNAKLITSFPLTKPLKEVLKKERLHRYHIIPIDPELLQRGRKKYKIKRKKGCQ